LHKENNPTPSIAASSKTFENNTEDGDKYHLNKGSGADSSRRGKVPPHGMGVLGRSQEPVPKSKFTSIPRFAEKILDKETGKLVTGKKLQNRDEMRSGKFCIMLNKDPDYGGFPICVVIRARAMIAGCKGYSLEEDSSNCK